MIIRKKPIIEKSDRVIKNDLEGVFSDFALGLSESNYNLDIFYKNINSLEISRVNREDMAMATNVCQYNIISNSINYLEDYFLLGIMHELFHLSATVKLDDKFVYSGFMQYDLETGEAIGSGLSEAYTAILDRRYFGDYCTNKMEFAKSAYEITRYLVSLLEDIVGDTLMEGYYSNADLYGLAKRLAMFTSSKETFRFIHYLDYISYYFESLKRPKKLGKVLFYYQECLKYIGVLYINVLEYLRRDNLVSDVEYKEFLRNVKTIIKAPLKIGKLKIIKSRTMNDEECNIFINKTLEDCQKKIYLVK